MKNKFVLMVCMTTLIACVPPKNEQPTQSFDSLANDSLLLGDSVTFPNDYIDPENDTTGIAIKGKLELLKSNFNEKSGDAYTIAISMQGYEYSSDITWYFDSAFQLLYYYENWSMEGNSGSRYAFFNAGKLIASYDEDYNGDRRSETFAHQGFTGKTFNDDETYTDLDTKYLSTRDEELNRQLQETLQLISENAENDTDQEGTITVHTESQADYGGVSVTETTDCILSKALFEKLVQPGT